MNYAEYFAYLRATLDANRKMDEANRQLQAILDRRTREDWALYIHVDPSLPSGVIQCQDVTVYNIKEE